MWGNMGERERGNMQRLRGWSAAGMKEEGFNEGWEIHWSGEKGDVLVWLGKEQVAGVRLLRVHHGMAGRWWTSVLT